MRWLWRLLPHRHIWRRARKDEPRNLKICRRCIEVRDVKRRKPRDST